MGGTRCLQLEREIRKNHPHKHIVLLLNKVDLVPTWATRRWVRILTVDFPTLAFHASITNPFGKAALINLLRQFGNLMKERKHVTVGMVGYPNVGKSSVINAMKRKKVCKAAPVPGETKVWQYISLSKKIYLLDCPGVCPPTENDFAADCAKVLKGVVRAERIASPEDYIDEVISRVKRPYLLQKYKLPAETTWEDGEDFLSILARKMGKLWKGGEPDLNITARIVLYDWQRGRIPFFTMPPKADEGEDGKDEGKAEDTSKEKDTATPEGAPPAAVEDATPPAAGAETSAPADATAGSATASVAAGPPEGTAPAATASKEVSTSALEEEVGAEIASLSVRQSLAELACSVQFDEEDMCGDGVEEARKEGGSSSRKRRHGADAAGAPKKKKRRKAKRLGGGANTAAAAGPGSLDWKAMVAEFGLD
eukprot:NODE_881_length_1327_cov_243.731132.p1 GENE.NODE_881_length_1327_cov_243.731132~~NODE_881_length_1327_cov_243.731132.p1  ORF type:complete len:424 (+),score=132.18 NODE_881_length_1327_cov_243.731132:3-1274(+)